MQRADYVTAQRDPLVSLFFIIVLWFSWDICTLILIWFLKCLRSYFKYNLICFIGNGNCNLYREAWSILDSLFITIQDLFLFIVESFFSWLLSFLTPLFPDICLYFTINTTCIQFTCGFPTTTSIVNKHHFLQNQSCHCRVVDLHHCGPSTQAISQWGRGKTHDSIITAVAAWMASFLTIVWMPLDSAISAWFIFSVLPVFVCFFWVILCA